MKHSEVLRGQGTAPQLPTLQWFRQHKDGKIPRGDPTGAAVPAVLHACLTALDRHGTKTFAEVAAPMLRTLGTIIQKAGPAEEEHVDQ
ncbi:MAG: gamma-glutamyltransferase [Pirellulaceae bacterium]